MSSAIGQITVHVDGFDVVVERLEDGTFRKPAYLNKAEREVIGKGINYDAKVKHGGTWTGGVYAQDKYTGANGPLVTAPATPEAQQWNGWGSALKPSHENWLLVRKPLAEKTIAAQVLATGTGALNIDVSRIGYASDSDYEQARAGTQRMFNNVRDQKNTEGWARPWNETNPRTDADKIVKQQGRFPSNTLFSHSSECVALGEKRVRVNDKEHDRHNGARIDRTIYGDYDANVTTGYADSEGMETVAAYSCWKGGIISFPSFSYKHDDVLPCSSPLYLVDRLADVLADLDTYSKACSDPLHHTCASSRSGDKQPFSLDDLRHAAPHEVADALGLSRFVNSLFGCPSCLHLCGEHVRLLATASQDGLPSLVGALSDAHSCLSRLVHTPMSQCRVLSNSDDSLQPYNVEHIPENKKHVHGVSRSKTSHETLSHREGTLFEASQPVEHHDSTHENKTYENGRHERCVDNGCRSDLVRLLVFLALDISSRLLSIDIIQQKRIDINTSPCPVWLLDRQSGVRKGTKPYERGAIASNRHGIYGAKDKPIGHVDTNYGDTGTAARYFKTFPSVEDMVPFTYQSKASRKDRSSNGVVNNTHPTCKPLSLMKYLISMICPPGGIVLDFFGGSGTTGVAAAQCGFHYILIEQEQEYVDICRARLAHVHAGSPSTVAPVREKTREHRVLGDVGQKASRCPEHDASYPSGSNNYTCGCKIVRGKASATPATRERPVDTRPTLWEVQE